MESMDPQLLLIGPACAVVLHELILRRYEVDHLASSIIALSTSIYLVGVWYAGFACTTAIAASFWIPLWLYIAVYRMFFHPLRKFPGPFWAKLSTSWTAWKFYSTGMHFNRLQLEMQQEYGNFVRTGPRELAIFDAEAISHVLGVQAKTSKGPHYDVMEKSIHFTRDKVWHRQRRKVWDNAFKYSLSDYAPRLEDITTKVITRICKAKGEPVLLLELVNSFAYDVMSDVAFGKPMGLIDGTSTQETNDVLKKVNDGLALFGLLENVPWTLKALDVITSRVGPLKDWTDWSVSQIEARMALKDAKLDLVQHLIDNTPDDEEGRRLMHGDSRILIAAGSETIASALSFINVQLATHPQYIIKLRKELEQTVPFDSQRPLPLLDAVINESMRLWPSIFHGSRRVTPPEGITVLGQYIPGNMIVQVPPFPLNRDPRFFVQPDEFMPERWMDGSKLVLNKDAFMPFSRGPYSCAGKALAMMEMRSVVARVVGEFDIRLPEGFVAEEYWDKVKDQATAGAPRDQVISFVKIGR